MNKCVVLTSNTLRWVCNPPVLCCVCGFRWCDQWVQWLWSERQSEAGGGRLVSRTVLWPSSSPHGFCSQSIWHGLPQTQGNYPCPRFTWTWLYLDRETSAVTMKQSQPSFNRFFFPRLVTSSTSSVSLQWAFGQACSTTKWATSSSSMLTFWWRKKKKRRLPKSDSRSCAKDLDLKHCWSYWNAWIWRWGPDLLTWGLLS